MFLVDANVLIDARQMCATGARLDLMLSGPDVDGPSALTIRGRDR